MTHSLSNTKDLHVGPNKQIYPHPIKSTAALRSFKIPGTFCGRGPWLLKRKENNVHIFLNTTEQRILNNFVDYAKFHCDDKVTIIVNNRMKNTSKKYMI